MNDPAVPAYIGVGSNLNDPGAQVLKAFNGMAELPHTRLVARSGLYLSAPMGPQDQADYINAVALLETRLDASELLHHLQALEDASGRVREQHWGPRTLDLDILLYGESVIESKELKVPHPGLTQRAFVVCPLAELAPRLVVPGAGALQDYMNLCEQDGLRRLDDV